MLPTLVIEATTNEWWSRQPKSLIDSLVIETTTVGCCVECCVVCGLVHPQRVLSNRWLSLWLPMSVVDLYTLEDLASNDYRRVVETRWWLHVPSRWQPTSLIDSLVTEITSNEVDETRWWLKRQPTRRWDSLVAASFRNPMPGAFTLCDSSCCFNMKNLTE
jgi:hypothetical protein